jgi:Putative peptidoglycan binding domain
MTPLHVLRWFMGAAIAALFLATVQPAAASRIGGGMAGGHGDMGGRGGTRTAPHFSSARGPVHTSGHFRDRDFDRDDRFFRHHHNRFIFVFDFAAFGFPWWYPDYYWYPPYYGYGPVYDPQYWTNLAVSVQSGLAQRGYYHGAIDGEIGSGSRQAIRAFQAAQGLPVTGMIDPKLLKALGIKYKTA